jgi:hypothetical protein
MIRVQERRRILTYIGKPKLTAATLGNLKWAIRRLPSLSFGGSFHRGVSGSVPRAIPCPTSAIACTSFGGRRAKTGT